MNKRNGDVRGNGDKQRASGDEFPAGVGSAVRLLIADDNRVVREGIANLLHGTDVSVVGCTAEGQEALRAIDELRPNMVLALAPKQRTELTRQVTRRYPEVKVVVMGVSEVAAEIGAAVEAGAAGYILSDASVEEFATTLKTIAEGEAPCSPKIVASLFARLAKLTADRDNGGAAGRLTRREVEILALIAEGLTNKQIAGRLEIEVQTVKNHVHSILEKFEVHDRLVAVRRAMDAGLLPER